MTNGDLKAVKAGYGTTSSGATTIFVNIEFNKEGTQKFKDITNEELLKEIVDKWAKAIKGIEDTEDEEAKE